MVANLSPERNRLLIGECDDRASERVARLRAALNEASIDSPEVTQIRETIWSKLLTNMSMSVLCLLTGQTARAVRDDPDLAEIVPRLLDEANSIAQSCFPEVKRVTRSGPAPDHKPSILQDYELGRAMEIDVLVRAPAAFARAAGLVDADARHDGGARDPPGARQGALSGLKAGLFQARSERLQSQPPKQLPVGLVLRIAGRQQGVADEDRIRPCKEAERLHLVGHGRAAR